MKWTVHRIIIGFAAASVVAGAALILFGLAGLAWWAGWLG
jgi:hypothetical protein